MPGRAADAEAAGAPLPLPLLLGLAALLGAAAFLPVRAGWVAALAAILLLGVPHGALDAEVARPLLRPRLGRAWFPAFALPYLALSAAVLLGWRLAPGAALMAFLAVSVLHFGEEDAGPGRPLEALARGGLPIALPALLHPAETARIFEAVTLAPMPALPGWWRDAALAWALLAPVAVLPMLARGRGRGVAEMAALVLAFAALPPLLAFALYFVALHAPRHMRGLLRDPVLAPRLGGMAGAVRRALPVTALTFLLGLLLWPLFPGAVPERLLALTLQGLSALTLPHLLLAALAARASRAAGCGAGNPAPAGGPALPDFKTGTVPATCARRSFQDPPPWPTPSTSS